MFTYPTNQELQNLGEVVGNLDEGCTIIYEYEGATYMSLCDDTVVTSGEYFRLEALAM